jgi:hypothetical protein
MTGFPAFQHPTAPVQIAVSDSALGQNHIQAETYWSNARGECVPLVPVVSLSVGTPSFPSGSPNFVSSATLITINATDGGSGAGVASVSFRDFPSGSPPPTFQIAPGASASFNLMGADGPFEIDFFAQSNDNYLCAAQSASLTLDNTAPSISIVQPAATNYVHSAVLTLNYSVSDGAGSGVASISPTMDGSATLAGHGLASGQAINLLTELSLGMHTFTVTAEDNVANVSAPVSVTFSIIVTAESIKGDVNQFLASGKIDNAGIATSLLAKLDAAEDARTRGQCNTADNIYNAFIQEVMALSGVHIDPTAASILIADAQYLIAHCP